MSLWIDVLCGTHGNETLGPALHAQLTKSPVDGVRSRIAHPDAVRLGKRFLGDQSELMNHYPGDPSGDPEDVAAYSNMRWLGSRANDEAVLIFDIHNSNSVSSSYFVAGARALTAGLTAAHRLGYRRCLVSDSPFYKVVRNGTAIETLVRTPLEYEAAIKKLYAWLSGLAESNPSSLLQEYESVAPGMSFYRKNDIPTLMPDGSLSPLLLDLEHTTVNQADGRLRLSQMLLNAFGLDNGTEIWAETWNHQNMSPPRPDLGWDHAGRMRRLFFGALVYRIPAPVRDGKWLVFPNLSPATQTAGRVSSRTI